MSKPTGTISQLGVSGSITQKEVSGSISESAAFNWSAYWASRYPSDLVSTVDSDTQITLNWTNNGDTDYDGVSIERSTDGITYAEIDTGSVGDTSYIDDTCVADTTYYYRVRYYRGTHYSDYCDPANTTSWTSQYNTVYDSWTNKPSAADSEKYNALIKSWIDDGVWAKKDVLYNFAIHTNDDGEALKNWKNPGTHDATLVNAPAFVAYEGFTGNGTTSYIDTNYNPGTDAINYALDDASVGIYFRTNTIYTNYELHGVWSTLGASRRIQLNRDNNFSDFYAIALNSGIDNQVSTDRLNGMYIGSRTANNIQKLYVNKTAKVNGTEITITIPDQNVCILALLKNDGNPDYFENDQISYCFLGSGMTQDNVDDDTDAFESYMDSNGKGVIT